MTRAKSAALQAVLVCMTLAAYLPAVRAGFIWDDDAYVAENQTLQSIEGLRAIWFQPSALPQYYPLVHTSFWIEYHLWGLSPAGYHLINILLHAADALLVWRVLKILNVPGAALAGFIFALHPVNVESVAWITERKNVLSLLFYLLALLAYLRFSPPDAVKVRRKPQWRQYWIALALLLCALLSKTVTCSLPAALLLIYWWKNGRIGRRNVMPLVPMFLCGAVFGYITIGLEKSHVGAQGTEWALSFLQRCLIAGRALWFYAGKLAWPTDLSFIYPKWTIDTSVVWQYYYPASALALAASFFLLRGRIGRGPVTAVLFFAASVFPALGFFNIYPMLYSFVADHFQYLASIGLIAGFSALCAMLWQRYLTATAHRSMQWVASTALLVVLGTLTGLQAAIYRNPETLWRDTLRKNPASWMAHENLGVYYAGQGRLDVALVHYSEALRLHPDDANVRHDMGTALARQGRYAEATEQLRIAVRLRPEFYEAHYNLGISLFQQQLYAEAIPPLTEALRLKGDDPQAQHMLAQAYAGVGRLAEAAQHYRVALALKPDWPAAMNDLAWLLATAENPKTRDGEEAVRLAKRTCELTGYRDVNYLDTLAAAYAESGNFAEAVRIGQSTLELARSFAQDVKALEEYRSRLECYRQGVPYRDRLATGR